MFEQKNIFMALMVITTIGLVVSPVMGLTTQTATGVQLYGSNSINIAMNINSGGSINQNVVSTQIGSNSIQALVNYNRGSIDNQNLIRTQIGNNKKFIKFNFNF